MPPIDVNTLITNLIGSTPTLAALVIAWWLAERRAGAATVRALDAERRLRAVLREAKSFAAEDSTDGDEPRDIPF